MIGTVAHSGVGANTSVASKSQFGQSRMIVGAATKRPMKLPVFSLDGLVVDARVAMCHQPLFVECPVLIAVAAEPVAGLVVPLIHKAYRDAMSVEGP